MFNKGDVYKILVKRNSKLDCPLFRHKRLILIKFFGSKKPLPMFMSNIKINVGTVLFLRISTSTGLRHLSILFQNCSFTTMVNIGQNL